MATPKNYCGRHGAVVEPQPEIKLNPESLFPEAMLLLGSVWDTTVQSVLGEKSKMMDGYLNLFYIMFYGQLAMLDYERITCKHVLSRMIPILNWLVRRNSDSSIANNLASYKRSKLDCN